MPALPVAPQVLKVQINFNWGGDTAAQIRFFIHYTGTAPTAAQAAAFATAVATNWRTNMSPQYSAGYVQSGVVVTDLNSATGSVAADNSSGAGTRTGTSVPNQIATNILFGIARRYRGGKPKIFMPPGVAADVTSGNVWTSAYLTATLAAWNAFITAILAAPWTGGGTLTQVAVSYYSGFHVVTNPVTGRARNVPTVRASTLVDNVLTSAIEDTPAVQRRRSLGRA